MSTIEIVWFTAAFLTTIAYIPLDIKLIRNKQTHDISLPMYIMLTIGMLLWFVYAYLNGYYPLMIAKAFSLSFASIILFYKIKYG